MLAEKYQFNLPLAEQFILEKKKQNKQNHMRVHILPIYKNSFTFTGTRQNIDMSEV